MNKGPKSIPSQVQLPGGVMLKGMPFKIVAYNADGSPKTFELLPSKPHDQKPADGCTLFTQEAWIRSPVQDKASSNSIDTTGQVRLPGGVILKGMPFKIVAFHPDGSPKTFELQPPNPQADGGCVLFAQEEWIRCPVPGKASSIQRTTP